MTSGVVFVIILTFFWFLAFIKKLFFWIYLWQLKEYHWGRFKAHFDTYQGKHLIFNFLNFSKFILLLFPVLLPFISRKPNFNLFAFYLFLIFLIFALEGLKFLFGLFKRKVKLPILTFKTLLVIFLGLLTTFFILLFSFSFAGGSFFYYIFLISDFLAPLIVSSLVGFAHLFTIVWRWNLIKKAAKKRQQFPRLTVIGITGSFGKTSTKEFLAKILENHFKILKTEANQNSEVGVSQTILQKLQPEHEVFICEMGAYSPGGIKLLASITQPKIGVLTGINEQHLATFGSEEKIIKTKYELIDSLPDEGLAVFNGDNHHCRQLYEKTKIAKIIVFSGVPKHFPIVKYWIWRNLWAEDIKVEKEHLSFKICTKKQQFPLKVNLLGKHNIPNLLMAVAVARRLGLTLEEIIKEIPKIKSDLGPLRLIKTKSGLNIIDSSYSANPDGVVADLEYLKVWEGKRAIVMPCLIELGKKAKEVHFRIGQKIGEVCDLAIITTKDYFKEIQRGTESEGMEREKVIYLEKPEAVFEKLRDFRGPEDIILIEGRVKEEIKKRLENEFLSTV